MRYINSHYITALFATLLFASCGADDDISNSTEQVNIHIIVEMSDAETRAGTWGDDDYTKEEATAQENAIDANKLQVLVYDSNDNFICEVANKWVIPHKEKKNKYIEVYGSLSLDSTYDNIEKLACRLVVLANVDANVKPAKGDPLSKITTTLFNFLPETGDSSDFYIPMWGVQTYKESNADEYQPLTVKKGETAQANTINILRAMSKIRVSITDDVADEYTLQSVSISNYNTYGYIMPTGYTVDATTELYYEDDSSPLTFNPKTNNSNKALTFNANNTGTTFTAYVPEYRTQEKSGGSTDPYISVTLKPKSSSGSAATYQIGLYRDIENSSGIMNLIRNTIYDYTITLVGPELSLKYQAIDWTAGGGDIIFY